MKADITIQPKYRIVANSLRQQIYSGEFKPGDRLPSFKEMRVRQGITQPTMERAHALLEREGLIRREQGRGTFVLRPAKEGASGSPQAQHQIMDHTVAILTPDEYGAPQTGHTNGGWREHITSGVMERARAECLHILTIHPDRIAQGGFRQIVQAQPYGVIFTDIENITEEMNALLNALKHVNIPVALYGNAPAFAGFDRIIPDQETGAYELTKWMIAHGRRRIRNVWPYPATSYYFVDRLTGYRSAMKEAGLEPMEPILYAMPDIPSAPQPFFDRYVRGLVGYLVEDLLGDTPSDAFLCSTDGDVFTIAAACRLLNKEPNKDIFLAGFDNYWPESFHREYNSDIPIVTIDKHNRLLGATLIDMLQERIQGLLPLEPQCRKVTPELIETSVAALVV